MLNQATGAEREKEGAMKGKKKDSQRAERGSEFN